MFSLWRVRGRFWPLQEKHGALQDEPGEPDPETPTADAGAEKRRSMSGDSDDLEDMLELEVPPETV